MTVQVAPSISACPANQTVNTDPGTCTALVSFTPPTATAGCPAPTVTCRIGATPITSPHAFPVGTSTVTCTASNGVAPDASCSFTVTVNDTENPAITCPANITATENPPGSGAAVVTYAAPVGTDACPGATTTQTAGLPSGNAFPVGVTTNTFRVTDAAGNMANCSFTVTVVLAPDLSLTKSHTGNFRQGQTGATYTMTATNSGGSPTSGTVTLSDTVPTGLTPTAASGTGWNCGITGAMVNCTRSDALAGAASYPPVTLTVDVAPNAPPSVTNTATISGGGDVNTANNTASDVTTIIPGQDLTVAKSHAGNFIQGQTGAQFTVTVTNCRWLSDQRRRHPGRQCPCGTDSHRGDRHGLDLRPHRRDGQLHPQRRAGAGSELRAGHDHRGCRTQRPPIGDQHGDRLRAVAMSIPRTTAHPMSRPSLRDRTRSSPRVTRVASYRGRPEHNLP